MADVLVVPMEPQTLPYRHATARSSRSMETTSMVFTQWRATIMTNFVVVSQPHIGQCTEKLMKSIPSGIWFSIKITTNGGSTGNWIMIVVAGVIGRVSKMYFFNYASSYRKHDMVETPLKVKRPCFVLINVTQNGKTAVVMVCSSSALMTRMMTAPILLPHLAQNQPQLNLNQLQYAETIIFTTKTLFFTIVNRSKVHIKKEQPLIFPVPSILIQHWTE